MNGARGLESAEHSRQKWIRTGDGGRHCQASDTGKGQSDEYDEEIGELLKQAVLRTAGCRTDFEAKMVFEILPDGA